MNEQAAHLVDRVLPQVPYRQWGDSLERLSALLALPEHYTRTRHMLQVRVVDDTDAPSVAFIYRELDEERSPCAGYLQCIVPADHTLEDFTQLTLSVLGLGLWWSASAGYLASWNLAERATSFATLRRWCRRYHGLDVQDPDVTVRRATQSLTGLNWNWSGRSRAPPSAGATGKMAPGRSTTSWVS